MAIYILGTENGTVSNEVDLYEEIQGAGGQEACQVKYIITDMLGTEGINRYKEAGIEANQLVGMHQYLTGNLSLESSMKAEEAVERLKNSLHCTEVSHRDTEIWLIKDGYVVASVLLDEKNKDCLAAICYYSYAKLCRMEFYKECVVYMDSYITVKSEQGLYAKLIRRTFYNKDGSVAYNRMFNFGDEEQYLFPDGRLYTKTQMIEEFVRRLDLSEEDVILVDASVSADVMRAFFTFGKAARIVVLLRMGGIADKEGMFPSGYFYDWFPYMEMLDSVVVSTEEQKKLLLEELKTYHCNVPDVIVVPINGKFISVFLQKSSNEDGSFDLSWIYRGKADGFWIYDEFGKRIFETRDMRQRHFQIKGYREENGFVLKAFVDTLKGKLAIVDSEWIHVADKKAVNIMDMQETLKFVKNHRISIARFGDGEVDLMTGHSIPYQDYDEGLAKRLKEIITLPDNEKLLVCLPDVFDGRERYNAACNDFWKQHLEAYQDFYAEVVTSEKHYGSTFISRPYIDLVDKSVSEGHFRKMKEFFANQNILIVEGVYSRSGVGNDLFQGARSVERIICPSRNAYGKYDEILTEVRRHGAGKLILLMLGPTAKVLAYDLAFEGYWAVDIGHIDSEYEWYKMGATHKTKFKNKHAAEFNFDENIELQNDDTYTKEIVANLSE